MTTNARINLLTFVTALLVWISAAWFLQSPLNANAVSRMALAIGLATEGSAVIDDYQAFTIDKALLEGHYYSDKAPGMAFMATPVVAVVTKGLAAIGRPLELIDGGELSWHYFWLTFLCIVMTSGLLAALAATVLLRTALALGVPPGGALAATLAGALATPLFGWSTAFFGHAAAAALLFLAFAMIRDVTGRRTPDVARAALAGALLAWAVVVEFPVAPASALIALYGLFRLRRWPARQTTKILVAAILGGFVAGLPLFIYNTATFGGPFSLGYQHVVGFEGMQQGFLGLTLPEPGVVVEILFLPYRGILWLAPVLLLVPWGLARMWRQARAEALLILGIALYFLSFNAAYHYWDGGWSTGPRHITPILPFLALALAFTWRGGAMKGVFVALAAVGAAISVICASTTMTASVEHAFPLIDQLWPRFRDGFIGFSPAVVSLLPVKQWAALAPLAAIWILGGLLMWRLAPVQAGSGSPSARRQHMME